MSLEFNHYFFTLFYESSATRFLTTLKHKIKVISMLEKKEISTLDEDIKVITLKELDAQSAILEKEDEVETEGNQNQEPKVNFDSIKVNDSDVSFTYVDMTNLANERNNHSKAIMPHQMPTWEETGAKVSTP